MDEFCSNEFNEFCENSDVKRLLVVPRPLQQNEMVERKHKNIFNIIRTILKTKLPKEFWIGAIDWVVYL